MNEKTRLGDGQIMHISDGYSRSGTAYRTGAECDYVASLLQ